MIRFTRTRLLFRTLPELKGIQRRSFATETPFRAQILKPDVQYTVRVIELSSRKLLESDAAKLLSYKFVCPDDSFGKGVSIYIIGSGVTTTHEDFEDRAIKGANFSCKDDVDHTGHGTRCASIAAGRRFGVARKANIISVKLMDSHLVKDYPSDGITQALDWIHEHAQSHGGPSIVCLSWQTAKPNELVKEAFNRLVQAGIHIVVAAGNDSVDVGDTYPACSRLVVTVGASNIKDERSSFSNYGPAVNLFAPGEDMMTPSPCPKDPQHLSLVSGTSYAVSLVAGVIANMISRDGNIPPGEMIRKLEERSLKGVLSNIPDSRTKNQLIHDS